MLKKNDFSSRLSPFIHKANQFMTMPHYILLIMLLTAFSNLFGLELPVYTLFVIIILFVCLFGKDLLPIAPIMICCYVAPSVQNNPGRNTATIFSLESGGIYIAFLAAILTAAFLYRVIRDRKTFFNKKYALLPGMLILVAAYLLSGIGSKNYLSHAWRNVLFALFNGAAIMLPYLLFSGGVDWTRARKDYLAWIGFGLGCLLLCEILWIYWIGNVVVDGVIERRTIFTGWGMYNNIGALLATMIPFPFYLATKYRKGWIGTFVGSLFLIGVVLTCSRASILCGGGIWFVSVVLMLYFVKNRRANTLTVAIFVGFVFISVTFFSKPLLNLFSSLLDHGLDPSNRDTISVLGFKLFAKYPLFGGSFFSTEYAPWGWSINKDFTAFFPPRWHNTFVQLFASCGSAGVAAYLLHRWQTVKLFIDTRAPEKLFTACSIIVLLATSLFDCHFFNVGPVLFYSISLAFAENILKQ